MVPGGARGLDDVPIEPRDCRWVWAQLRERVKDEGEACQLLIPETVLFTNGEPSVWLHSDPHERIEERALARPARGGGVNGGGARGGASALQHLRHVLHAAAHASMATPTLATDRAAADKVNGLAPAASGARTAAAAAALAAADASKLPPPPFSAVARRLVKGGELRGFLLPAAALREVLLGGAGASALLGVLQAYVHAANGPGARLRCRFEVGLDGHARSSVCALTYPIDAGGAGDGTGLPAASRSVSISELAELPPPAPGAQPLRSRSGQLHAKATDAIARVVQHVQRVAHVQVIGMLADFVLDAFGRLWFVNCPQAHVRTRDLPLRSSSDQRSGALSRGGSVRAHSERVLHRLLQRSAAGAVEWCCGDHCAAGYRLPRRTREHAARRAPRVAPLPPPAVAGVGGAERRAGAPAAAAAPAAVADASGDVRAADAEKDELGALPPAEQPQQPAADSAEATRPTVTPAEPVEPAAAMAGAPAAAAETPLPPSARALASAPAFATSEGERGAGGDGDGEGEGDELLSDSETIPPPSFKVLLVDARSGLTSHARGYRTQYKSVLLGRLEALLGQMVDDSADAGDTWHQALQARLGPSAYHRRLPVCESCCAAYKRHDAARRHAAADGSSAPLASRVLDSAAGGERSLGGGRGLASRSASAPVLLPQLSARTAASATAAPSLPSPSSRLHTAGSRASRRSTPSRLEARALEPQAPIVLGELPRLSIAPQLVTGALGPDVDWAGMARSADASLRRVKVPPDTQPRHSHIRWPTVSAGAQLRPSLRKVLSLPAVK
ncbi:hypothetical protein KFE25_011082 [Diacronema lutheri]|uniref:Uncharacterized protein n=2 Tax=Diacronema lutheri TaxID=2081491 RepID=A0A8J6CAX7_DIALT|nr:hypothetical protein KFE25_011082 [Diacronema lutheri]